MLRLRKIAIIFACALLLPTLSSAADSYYAQAAAGSVDGSSCANAKSVATFNGGTETGGNTYHFCGTITTAITVASSGSAGNFITLQWESGASIQVCSTTGALKLPNRNFVIVDLGGNATAIECPNNGTGLGTTVNAVGVSLSSQTNIEIRNGTIGPLYQYSGTGSDGLSSVCVNANAPSNIFYHDLSLNNCNQGFNFSLSGTTSGNEIAFNTVASSVGRAIAYNNGTGSGTDTGTRIHDNDLSLGDGWYSGATDATHIEIIQSFNDGGSGTDSISNMQIYNNYFHGSSRGDSTSFIFIPDGLACPSTNSSWEGKIYNNIFVLDPASSSAPGDGFIFTQDCHHTIAIYNNTMDGGSNAHGTCIELQNTNTVTMKNNIMMNCQTMFYNAGSGITLVEDHDTWFNTGSGQWYWQGVNKTTLSAWTTATGQGTGDTATNPGLNTDYTITSTGSAVYRTGINLTSLSITQLDTGAPQTFGASGACGTGCVVRPGSVAWDLGALPYSTVVPVTAPSGFLFADLTIGDIIE